MPDRERQHRCRQRTRQDERAQPGTDHDFSRVAREDVADLCLASKPMTTARPPRLFTYAARPAAARMTTTRFIRFGPAPSAPRNPAVPNSSRPAKRSASSLVVGDDQRLELRAGVRVGVFGQPRPGPMS